MGLNLPKQFLLGELLVRRLGHLFGEDPFGDLAELRTVDLRHLVGIERLARHDPQRLVRGQQLAVEFVLRVEGGVIEDELHHFEQVVSEDVRVTLADCRELDIVDRLRLLPPWNSERVVILTCSICPTMRWNRS